jgi:hypothetical protein
VVLGGAARCFNYGRRLCAGSGWQRGGRAPIVAIRDGSVGAGQADYREPARLIDKDACRVEQERDG